MRPSIPLTVVAVLLAGCSSVPERRDEPAPSPVLPSRDMIQAAQLTSHVLALQSLVQGNPTEKAELMDRARAGYEDAKAGPAALRYGLLLAAPEHPQRDAATAQRVLREAMAQAELLSAAERALGTVELARLNVELRLQTEVDRLIAELQQERDRTRTASASANTSLNRRLQTEMDETARLRKALDEAKAKLDAITRMERNVPDRPPAPEGRNP